jgi:HJR/Mrr/RecB family endonuclease
MAKPDGDLFDRLLVGLVTRVSGRTVAAIALVLYPGIGLVLPLSLNWSVPWLVDANLTCTLLAASVTLGWFAVQVEARDRRHLVEWTTDLRLLDAAEFEWLVGELFRREGWQVEETGRQDAPDGNIDLRLTRAGEHRIVQCKRWTARLVGVDDVRAFAGTLLREALPGSAGIFVTLSDFTEQARSEARTAGVTLIDNRDLYAHVEKARRTEACPTCEAAMVLDRSARGWWFRCVAPGCAGKRDLSGDPARAVELLTHQ